MTDTKALETMRDFCASIEDKQSATLRMLNEMVGSRDRAEEAHEEPDNIMSHLWGHLNCINALMNDIKYQVEQLYEQL